MEVQYFAAEISTVNPQIPTANPKWPAAFVAADGIASTLFRIFHASFCAK